MVSYKFLIEKYQDKDRKTAFDINQAVTDIVGNKSLTDSEVQSIRSDLSKIFAEYTKLYKKHSYKKERFEKNEQSFLNREYKYRKTVSGKCIKF